MNKICIRHEGQALEKGSLSFLGTTNRKERLMNKIWI